MMSDGRILQTPRTNLCCLTPDDLADTHALWTDAGIRRYLWDDVVIDERRSAEVIAASVDHFARLRYGLWAVRDKATANLMGVCGFRPSEHGEPELLFAFWRRYWGQGLANEAARAVISYLFDVLGHATVVAATDVGNEASSRALLRLGMRFERRGRLNGLDTYFYRLDRDPRSPIPDP